MSDFSDEDRTLPAGGKSPGKAKGKTRPDSKTSSTKPGSKDPPSTKPGSKASTSTRPVSGPDAVRQAIDQAEEARAEAGGKNEQNENQKGGTPGSGRRRRKTSKSALGPPLTEGFECWHGPLKRAYVTIHHPDHDQHCYVDDSSVTDLLRERLERELDTYPSQEMINQVIGSLAKDGRRGPYHDVCLRFAERAGVLYVNLGRDDGAVIAVSDNKIEVVQRPPIRFVQTEEMLALPEPEPCEAEDLWAYLKEGLWIPYLNFDCEDDFKFWIVFVTFCFRPKGPYPLLMLRGSEGSAKSWTAARTQDLVDPNEVTLRSLPEDEEDLLVTAEKSHLSVFDNLSSLPLKSSDMLARLSTGAGAGVRRRYTSRQTELFKITKPVILTSIVDVIRQADLASRAIVLDLPEITEYRDPDELESAFRRDYAGLLGAILEAVRLGRRELPRVNVRSRERMAKTLFWGEALGRVFGWEPGSFVESYQRRRLASDAELLESNRPATVLLTMMRECGDWEGPVHDLLRDLSGRATDEERKAKAWPRDTQRLGQVLHRYRKPLRRFGVTWAKEEHGHRKTVTYEIHFQED